MAHLSEVWLPRDSHPLLGPASEQADPAPTSLPGPGYLTWAYCSRKTWNTHQREASLVSVRSCPRGSLGGPRAKFCCFCTPTGKHQEDPSSTPSSSRPPSEKSQTQSHAPSLPTHCLTPTAALQLLRRASSMICGSACQNADFQVLLINSGVQPWNQNFDISSEDDSIALGAPGYSIKLKNLDGTCDLLSWVLYLSIQPPLLEPGSH